MAPEIKKALTMRASSIGDCLMGKYLLENIHAAYPSAECFLLVSGRAAMIEDLLAAYPWINVLEASRKNPSKVFGALAKVFPSDVTVTQYSGRGKFATWSKIFARLVTKPGRLVGFTDKSSINKFLYDHLITFDKDKALRLHEEAALESLGIVPTIRKMSLIPKINLSIAQKLSLAPGSYIVLHLFTGSVNRGLPQERQVDITKSLLNLFRGDKKLVLTAGPGDELLLQHILKQVPDVVPVFGLSLQELIVFISESAGVVSIDTGVAHIAVQTGTPLVLFRPCAGYTWWNKDQYPESKLIVLSHDDACETCAINKNFPRCLNAITTEEIVSAARSMFKK